MIDVGANLGVQSWCFRNFKQHEDVIEKVKECGLDRVELSSAHVDWKDADSFDDVIKIYRDNGITICSIGVVPFADDESTERKYFEFVRKAGCKYIAIDFAVEQMPKCMEVADKLAQEYDVWLGIHNHGGQHWLGSGQMISDVLSRCSERIGLCLDTAWALDSGENPVAMAEKFADRLYGLHIKDFVFDRAREPEDVVVGTGNLNLPGLYETLKKMDFNGYVALEYEGDVDNPVPAVSKCVQAVRQQMTG